MPTLRGAAIACWWWGRVATSTHSPPVRRRVNRGTSYLRAKCRLRRLRSETRLRAQRSALRLFFAPRFARLRGDSLLVGGKVATSTHSPPVRRRVNRGTSSLCAPAVFAPRFARLRGDSLLVVGQGCYLHPFAACSAADEQRNILALRSGCFCTALRAIARHSLLVVGLGCYLHPFAACSAAGEQRNILALRSGCFCTALRAIARHSRAGKKITFPQKRKSQKEAPDTAWGRNTAPWVLSQQDKPSRMDTMAQFTLSHMILIIVPCRDNGVNTTRNVAPRRIFCIFVSTFGQYVKRPGSGSRRTQNSAAPDPAHDPILLIFSNLLVDVFI